MLISLTIATFQSDGQRFLGGLKKEFFNIPLGLLGVNNHGIWGAING
jgi:hypothetical protein